MEKNELYHNMLIFWEGPVYKEFKVNVTYVSHLRDLEPAEDPG